MYAAGQGKLNVMDKYLADGGNPNAHDEVFSPCVPVKQIQLQQFLFIIYLNFPVEEDGTTSRLSGGTHCGCPTSFRKRSRHKFSRSGKMCGHVACLEMMMRFREIIFTHYSLHCPEVSAINRIGPFHCVSAGLQSHTLGLQRRKTGSRQSPEKPWG